MVGGRVSGKGEISVPFLLAAQPGREAGNRLDSVLGRGAEHHPRPSPAVRAHLQKVECDPQGQYGSMVQHLARRAAGPPRVPLVARSAPPAGAARFPRGWSRAGAAAAAASAAAPDGLRTRQAAGARGARPFPRCHSDPRCLAPKPRPGLPQSKGNFLVSRQRNNAPEREGAPRSQRLRLPRGPEASQAGPPPPLLPPQPGVPSGDAGEGGSASSSSAFTFSFSVVLNLVVKSLNSA